MLGDDVLGGILDEHQWNIEQQTMPTAEKPITVSTKPEINLYITAEGMVVQLISGGKITRRTLVRPKNNRIDIDSLGRTMQKYGSGMSGFVTFVRMVDKMAEMSVDPPAIIRYSDPECNGSRAEFTISGGMKHLRERRITIRIIQNGFEDVIIEKPLCDDIKSVTSRFKYRK